MIVYNLENCTAYDSLTNAIKTAGINFSIRSEDDNVVGFLSQIGWTDNDDVDIPNKRIQFEKIYLFVDTDGGNSWGSRLHDKIPHRIKVFEKIKFILNT